MKIGETWGSLPQVRRPISREAAYLREVKRVFVVGISATAALAAVAFLGVRARKGKGTVGEKKTCRYAFFQNRECEMFPCHEGISAEEFNCLFCYCPLYCLGPGCGGSWTYTDRGVKSCADCTFPHRRENYDAVLRRFPELQRMGAEIKVEGRIAVVRGVRELHSATVYCTDLRGGAALAVAALAAQGESTLYQIEHIDRGYEQFEQNLSNIGASIRRES